MAKTLWISALVLLLALTLFYPLVDQTVLASLVTGVVPLNRVPPSGWTHGMLLTWKHPQPTRCWKQTPDFSRP